MSHRVWFITGTSQGFGHELVRAALGRGDRVVATSRDPQKVMAAFPQAADRLLALPMDLGQPDQIASVVKAAVKRFEKPNATRRSATEDLMWALINTPEFVFND